MAKFQRIEWRARRIADPVERLRFLRDAMAAAPRAREALLAMRSAWAGGVLALMLALGPAPLLVAPTTALSAKNPDTSAPASPRVWQVEHSSTLETYSNGLRIDLTFVVPNRPRARFPIFPLAAGGATKSGNAPVGIVYHTTESHLAPFEEDENRRLNEFGRNLLEAVRQERSYHYLIDRFGRVFRVVEERDAANHAGKSVWADADGVYVDLNDSFLGVAFEAQTGATEKVTAAQISAAKALTEMLRDRYGIAAGNCVTHAQVSVNPLNMHIGAHTDWAGNFPFAEVGLPDNYAIPLPSLYVFGFDYDSVFLQAAGARWKGLDLALDRIERQAAAEGMPPARYRAILRHRYKDIDRGFKGKQKESEGDT